MHTLIWKHRLSAVAPWHHWEVPLDSIIASKVATIVLISTSAASHPKQGKGDLWQRDGATVTDQVADICTHSIAALERQRKFRVHKGGDEVYKAVRDRRKYRAGSGRA